jgi:hypothetical protein
MVARELARRAEAKQDVLRFIVDGPEDEAKVAAARAAHPNAFIIVRRIVDSPMRHATRPDVAPEADQQADAVVARAAERIAKLREAR